MSGSVHEVTCAHVWMEWWGVSCVCALSLSIFIFILVLLSMFKLHLLLNVDVDVDDARDVDLHDANACVAEKTNCFGRFEQITPRQKRPET